MIKKKSCILAVRKSFFRYAKYSPLTVPFLIEKKTYFTPVSYREKFNKNYGLNKPTPD